MPEQSDWGVNLDAAICETCDWRYLLPAGLLPLQCPHCQQSALVAPDEAFPHSHPPELLLPFDVSAELLSERIQQFAGDIWFAPGDLQPETLKNRLQRVFLPMWLVDGQVESTWQAETGFNYEVVSHRDRFDEKRGGWHSQQITETRIRWEPRVGRLARKYQNVPAPALEEHFNLLRKLGEFNPKAGQPYQPQPVQQAIIRLPNRSPADAWPDAVPAFRTAAMEECRAAARADHIRDFRWSANYLHKNWTLLLLPIYFTYYLDDDRNPQPILIHGQTGYLSGPRRASMQRAQRTALIILAVAAAVFTLSLIAAAASLVAPPLLVVSIVGVTLAIIIGLAALFPIAIAWQFNRSQTRKPESVKH
jgi:hypothetical protein